ncbi:MAG: hypothetical protein ACRC06_05910, partial [Waterburya sp.]
SLIKTLNLEDKKLKTSWIYSKTFIKSDWRLAILSNILFKEKYFFMYYQSIFTNANTRIY